MRMWDGVAAMTPPPAGHTARNAGATADGKITRDMVLATALAIIDRDGADALTMRRLARALDRDPMILYRHAPSKAALLDGVAETVLAQLRSTPPTPTGPASCAPSPATTAGSPWPTRTSFRCWSPGRSPPRSGCARAAPSALSKTSSRCSPAPGSAGPDALHIYRALFGFLHGHILNELQELVENPDETDDLLRLGLHRLPIKDFPCSAASPPPSPATTALPNSSAASTSSSRGSPPH